LGKKSRPPAPPDPTKVAQAQTQSNKDTASFNAAINRGNTTTPFGSQTYSFRGNDPTTGAPIYDQEISLSPQAQGSLDRMYQAYSTPFDTSGLPQVMGAGDLEGARSQVQDALYRRQASYLDPQYQDRERELRTRLANQGVVEGSQAHDKAFRDFDMGRERDYAGARDAAIIGGGDELSRLYGISADTRDRAFGEALTTRGLPAQEFAQAYGQYLPQFQPAPDVAAAGTDVAGPIYSSYQGELNNYNAKQASRNALLGGLFGLGGAFLGGPAGGQFLGKIAPRMFGG
jgi:hypothetical protein